MAQTNGKEFDIPKTCKAGVVVNAGPDFTVEVEDVPVPEPGTHRMPFLMHSISCRGSYLHPVINTQ